MSKNKRNAKSTATTGGLPRGGATLALLGALVLAGCNTAPTRDPEFANVRPAVPRHVQPTAGAIYASNSDMRMFEDLRARRVGDILTVTLTERTQASKSADTEYSKESDTSIANPTLFGASGQLKLPGALPIANISPYTFETRLQSENEFSGDASSNQSNSLSGEITVSIVEVLPNGNMVIRGEKLMTLNQGHEHIRFSGIVRPYDIDASNTVPSTKVADARVVYAGQGPANETNAIGWLARFFNSPIFPW